MEKLTSNEAKNVVIEVARDVDLYKDVQPRTHWNHTTLKEEYKKPSEEIMDVLNIPCEIEYGYPPAFHYKKDKIRMPYLNNFDTPEDFYDTLFHEAIHSTGLPKRLNRLSERKSHIDEEKIKEELVATLGAMHIGLQLGIDKIKENKAYRNHYKPHERFKNYYGDYEEFLGEVFDDTWKASRWILT